MSFLVDFSLFVAGLPVGQRVTCLTPLANSEQRDLGRRKRCSAGSRIISTDTSPGSHFVGAFWSVRVGINLCVNYYHWDPKLRCKSSCQDSEIWNKAWVSEPGSLILKKYTQAQSQFAFVVGYSCWQWPFQRWSVGKAGQAKVSVSRS